MLLMGVGTDSNLRGEASAPIRNLTYFATPIPAFAFVVPSVLSVPSLRRYRRRVGLVIRSLLSFDRCRRSVGLSFLRFRIRAGLVPFVSPFRRSRRSVGFVVPFVLLFCPCRHSVGFVVPSVSSFLQFCGSGGLVVPSALATFALAASITL